MNYYYMRLLIIDDDKNIAQALSDFFRNNLYVADVAFDGESGLNLAINNYYDLIITDYLLPKIDGQKIINNLKENGSSVPILAISTCSEITNKIKLLEHGADDYLSKPFSFIELLARTKALLRRQPRSYEKILSFADLKLNLHTHEASRGKHNIYLTTKEFSIVQMFIKHPKIIFSKQEIIETVWDDASNPLSNIVEAHILHLRRKIDFKKPFLIQTVPGCGYRLSDSY